MSMLVLEGVNVYDPVKNKRIENTNVSIRDGVIVSIGEIPACETGVTRHTLPDHTVLPGLIDLHVHIVSSHTNLSYNARLPNFLAALRTMPILKGMLNRGFTTVRDCGGADFSVCEAVKIGLVPGPRVLASGKALSQTGGHGDFRQRSDLLDDACGCLSRIGAMARVVDGVDAIRIAVREELLKGASQIKVMASGGVASPNDPITNTQYSEAELRAAVEEAQAAGTYVLAHAYTARAIRRAVECGVRCIEHGNLVDEPTARFMLEQDVAMVPTLSTLDRLSEQGPELGFPPESLAKIETARSKGREALAILTKVGTKVGFGTDMLGELHPFQSDEFSVRAAIVGNAEAIRSATSVAAEIIGESGLRGTVAVGAIADLVVVDGDPVADISLLAGQGQHIPMIIKNGACVKIGGNILEH